jgi:stage II sporulation protein AA (anti-sigma F factor antagonist)
VNRAAPGQWQGVQDSPSPAPSAVPEVTSVLAGDTARLTLRGELTEAARRPLVRVLVDLLLQQPTLNRVELDLSGVSFMNSAGLAVLVQGQRMAAPRRIQLALVDPPEAVLRPLRLSGLWHRFDIVASGTASHPPEADASGEVR